MARTPAEVKPFIPSGWPFPLWLGDLERSKPHMTPEQKYLYLQVLVHLWDHGGYIHADHLENTCAALWKVKRRGKQFKINFQLTLGCLKVDVSVVGTPNPKLLTHPKLLSELERARKISDKGRAAAAKRWAKPDAGASDQEMLGHKKRYAPPTTTKKESITSASPPLSTPTPNLPTRPGQQDFRFAGGTIKITQADFKSWADLFPHLNLEAELVMIDDWWSDKSPKAKKRWFIATFRMLEKKNAFRTASTPSAEFEDRLIERDGLDGTTWFDPVSGSVYIKAPNGAFVPQSGGAI